MKQTEILLDKIIENNLRFNLTRQDFRLIEKYCVLYQIREGHGYRNIYGLFFNYLKKELKLNKIDFKTLEKY